jgi:hypothetical protein
MMKKEELKEKIVQEVKAAKAEIEKSSSGFAEEDLNVIQVFQEKLVPHEQELLLDIIQFLEDHQASPELIELRDEVYALAK